MNAPTHQAIRKGTKRYSVLHTLYQRGERGLTCFAAVSECSDYVLRSTVSDLHRDYGLRINSTPHAVPNSFGGTTHCALYVLPASEYDRAARLLGIDHDAVNNAA